MLEDGTIPAREVCDLDAPDEKFVWCFVDLPPVSGGSLILPVGMLQEISAHLDACGVQLACEACGHEKTPTVKWRPVIGGNPMLGNAGQWLPFDTPEDEANAAVKDVLDSVRPDVHRALIEDLAARYPGDETLADLKERLP